MALRMCLVSLFSVASAIWVQGQARRIAAAKAFLAYRNARLQTDR